MEERRTASQRGAVNYYSIFKDIARQWLTILLITLSVGMLTHVVLSQRYSPVYATKATMVVTKIGTDNNAYQNLRSASDSAKRFTQILNSSVLQKMVAEEIGLSRFHGSAKAENISNSNLLTLTVRAESPSISFREMKAILENYTIVSKEMMGDIHLTVLEQPEVPNGPEVALDTRRRVIQASAIALVLMLLILGFFSAMRDTIRSNKDVELKLDARLLATIYHEKKYKSFLRFRKSKKGILITDLTTSFRYVETLRKLASRVINGMDERGAKTVLVTSIMENEGKTTVAANLALAMSQQRKKVMIIDADFRKPAVYLVLNMKDAEFTSFSDVLKGETVPDIPLIQVPGTQLHALLNKNASPQSIEMFSSGRILKIIESCRKIMDYIVIDTSPMQLVADAEELGAMVDASVLCVKQHMVEAKDINDAIDVLNGEEKKVLGVVFNDVNLAGSSMSSMGYGYGYGYGYGGHYGQ
ncbi:MAG: polysaccharide biosynthesis tyrosine autokinase [Parasporobacterium sp.]|nr:polysaccharide biosynthesis tyrosine autokinase [Parasporobacterium sp.]